MSQYRIGIVQDDMTLKDSGEGPWDNYDDAVRFLENEVGVLAVVVGGPDMAPSVIYTEVYNRLSHETLAFSTKLQIDGVVVADVENDGQGGCHKYLWRNHADKRRVMAWAAGQETDYPLARLDQIVTSLVLESSRKKRKKATK